MQKIIYGFVFILSLFMTSCFQDEEIVYDIDVTTSTNESVVNSNVTLKAITKSGIDVTSESKFIVDGVEQNSNIITSNVEKIITVQAKYKERISTSKQVKFSLVVVGYKKMVLVEDYTGTWCGNCPRVTHALDLIRPQTTQVIEVAIHRGTPAQNEPFVFDASVLEAAESVNGYPSARINRTGIWSAQQQNNTQQVLQATNGVVKTGLAIENTVVNGMVNLKVKVGFVDNFTNLKLVVYVLENGLIYDQVNYTPFYGGVDPIPNFVHNHTLRSCVTNLMGDAIPNSSTVSGGLYTKYFSFPVPTNVANAANLEFVAFVVNANRTALNSRKCLPNVVQNLEVLN
jgi:hypothetical protein